MPRKKKTPKEKIALQWAKKREKEEKSKNFPYRGTKKVKDDRILPSHRLIFENYKKNGFRHLGKAIRETGAYSPTTADRVNVITKSKSWQALMNEQLPDEKLAMRHGELLDKRDVKTVKDEDGKEHQIDMGPNTAAVTKGLELAYRLKGAFNEQKEEKASTVMYNLFYKPEVREQMRVFEDSLKQTLIDEIARKNRKDMEEERRGQEQQRVIDAEYTEENGEA